MNHRERIARENLLLLSREQIDFEVAKEEWEHVGLPIDYGSPTETCQLCEKSGLRYHFEIVNQATKKNLQVGSNCIDKFDITVYGDEGRALVGKERRDKLEEDKNVVRHKMMGDALGKLSRMLPNDEQDLLLDYVDSFLERGGFSPQALLDVFKLMQHHEIEYNPRIYKVFLTTKLDRQALYEMHDDDRKTIIPALTSQQLKGLDRKIARRTGKPKELAKKNKRNWRVFEPKPAENPTTYQTVLKHENDPRDMYRELGLYVPSDPYDEQEEKFAIVLLDNAQKAVGVFFAGNSEDVNERIEWGKRHSKCAHIRVEETMTNKVLKLIYS